MIACPRDLHTRLEGATFGAIAEGLHEIPRAPEAGMINSHHGLRRDRAIVTIEAFKLKSLVGRWIT